MNKNRIPSKALNPAAATGQDRATLVYALEEFGIDRLTIERGRETQTIRQEDGVWRLTCRNTTYF